MGRRWITKEDTEEHHQHHLDPEIVRQFHLISPGPQRLTNVSLFFTRIGECTVAAL